MCPVLCVGVLVSLHATVMAQAGMALLLGIASPDLDTRAAAAGAVANISYAGNMHLLFDVRATRAGRASSPLLSRSASPNPHFCLLLEVLEVGLRCLWTRKSAEAAMEARPSRVPRQATPTSAGKDGKRTAVSKNLVAVTTTQLARQKVLAQSYQEALAVLVASIATHRHPSMTAASGRKPNTTPYNGASHDSPQGGEQGVPASSPGLDSARRVTFASAPNTPTTAHTANGNAGPPTPGLTSDSHVGASDSEDDGTDTESDADGASSDEDSERRNSVARVKRQALLTPVRVTDDGVQSAGGAPISRVEACILRSLLHCVFRQLHMRTESAHVVQVQTLAAASLAACVAIGVDSRATSVADQVATTGAGSRGKPLPTQVVSTPQANDSCPTALMDLVLVPEGCARVKTREMARRRGVASRSTMLTMHAGVKTAGSRARLPVALSMSSRGGSRPADSRKPNGKAAKRLRSAGTAAAFAHAAGYQSVDTPRSASTLSTSSGDSDDDDSNAGGGAGSGLDSVRSRAQLASDDEELDDKHSGNTFWMDVATLVHSQAKTESVSPAVALLALRLATELGAAGLSSLCEPATVAALTRVVYMHSKRLSLLSNPVPGPNGFPITWLYTLAPTEQLQLDTEACPDAMAITASALVGLWGAAYACAGTRRRATSAQPPSGLKRRLMNAQESTVHAMASARSIRSTSASLRVMVDEDAGMGVEQWTAPARCLAAILRGDNIVAAAHAAAALACLVKAYPALAPALVFLNVPEVIHGRLLRCSWLYTPRRCVV